MKFNFDFNKKDLEFKNLVEKELKHALDRFNKIFNKIISGELEVKIFSTRREYKDWTQYGEKYQNWMVGRCDPEGNVIGLIIPSEAERTQDDMLMVATHELYHYLLSKAFGDIKSIVLDEGMACYLSGQMPKDVILKGEIKKASELESDFASLGGYRLAPIFIKYLMEKYGSNKYIELINSNNYVVLLPRNFEKEAIINYNNQLNKKELN